MGNHSHVKIFCEGFGLDKQGKNSLKTAEHTSLNTLLKTVENFDFLLN